MSEGIKVSSIYKRFKGDFLNLEEKNKNREISLPSITRLGMELNGIFLNEEIISPVCWGKQESLFLNLFEETKQKTILEKILEKNPPLFLLSKNFQHEKLLVDLNKQLNNNESAIIKVDFSSVEIYALIGGWLSKACAQWTTLHGVALNIWGEGVLIIGNPGVGKSEAASELIRMNHLFLGDDAINVARIGSLIMARPHPISAGFMHIRGLGILNIKEMYGSMKIIDETKISVVVELKSTVIGSKEDKFENIGEEITHYDLLGVPLPLYTLPVTSGRNIGELIELAVIDMKLKKSGYNAAKEMDKKYKKIVTKNS